MSDDALSPRNEYLRIKSKTTGHLVVRIEELEIENAAAWAAAQDAIARADEADELIIAAWISGHREGWESGPSVDETMHRLLCYMSNHGLDARKEEALRALVGEEAKGE